MELKVIEMDKGVLKLEVVGEDHTFCNIIRKELWQDKDTEIAGYAIKHALVSNPILVVESKDPKKALVETSNRLKKKNDEFLKKFESI